MLPYPEAYAASCGTMSPAYCSKLSLGVSEALILIDLFIVSAVWSPRPQGDSMFI